MARACRGRKQHPGPHLGTPQGFGRSKRPASPPLHCARPRLPAGRCAAVACGGAGEPGGPASASRSSIHCRLAVPEYEQRCGARVFCRWHGRGHHHRTFAHQMAIRHRAQFELRLQGQSSRHTTTGARSWRPLRAPRQRAQIRRPRPHCRPTDRSTRRRASLGRAL